MEKYSTPNLIEEGRGYQIFTVESKSEPSNTFRLKIINLSEFTPDLCQRFLHEADFAFKSVHPNILPIIEYFICDNKLSLISPNFQSLGDYFREDQF
jgi:hypothetical protein